MGCKNSINDVTLRMINLGARVTPGVGTLVYPNAPLDHNVKNTVNHRAYIWSFQAE